MLRLCACVRVVEHAHMQLRLLLGAERCITLLSHQHDREVQETAVGWWGMRGGSVSLTDASIYVACRWTDGKEVYFPL